MKNPTFLLLYIILSYCTAASAQQEKTFHSYDSSAKTQSEGGWLWKISGNGLAHPAYLFGTYHGSPHILYGYVDSIPGFRQALDACSQYVGEVAYSNDSTSLFSNAKLPADTTYHDLLNKEDYQFVDSTLRHKMDVPLHRMYLKPGHLTMLLGKIDEITKLKKAGYSESQIDSIHSQVMDAVLEKKAKEKGYIINGLETISEQFEMMMPGDLKENATALAEYCRKEKEKDKEYTQFQTLTDALVEVYRSQSMKRLIEYEIQMDAFYLNASPYLQEIAIHQRKVLLKARNMNWITKLTGLIKDKTTFIAVGVRHLPGENGLITLLQKEGYKVDPVEVKR